MPSPSASPTSSSAANDELGTTRVAEGERSVLDGHWVWPLKGVS